MQLFNYFEPLIQYVAEQKTLAFASVDFVNFNAVVIRMIDDLDKATTDINPDILRLGKLAVYSWIDETVQRSDWAQKDQWQQQLLQERYLATANAGAAFFETLATLTAKDSDVIRVYYRCLILGFRGRYYRAEDIAEIRRIEEQCLSLMGIKVDTQTVNEPIFPLVYETTPNTVVKTSLLRAWYRTPWVLWGAPVLILVIIYLFFYGILHMTITNYIDLLK